MIHLGGTWVNGISGTMSLCNNIWTQIINIWHRQSALLSKHSILTKGEWFIHLTQPRIFWLHEYFALTSTTNEDSELEWTKTPPLSVSTSCTPNLDNWCISLTSSFFSSSICEILPMLSRSIHRLTYWPYLGDSTDSCHNPWEVLAITSGKDSTPSTWIHTEDSYGLHINMYTI